MKVFISWSGDESKRVALALRDWLPNVIQALDPWVSSSDIDKGEAWFASISESIVQAQGMGIFCLTSKNLNAQWLAYEAGAIASSDRGRVATFLLDIEPSAVKPPLGLFQATVSRSREDVFRLVETLNSRLAAPLAGPRLQIAFDTHWDKLSESLAKISIAPEKRPNTRVEPEKILEEILAVVRRIERDGFGRGEGSGSGLAMFAPMNATGSGGSLASGSGLLGDMQRFSDSGRAAAGLLAAAEANKSVREQLSHALESEQKNALIRLLRENPGLGLAPQASQEGMPKPPRTEGQRRKPKPD